jgi:hypothetical protein
MLVGMRRIVHEEMIKEGTYDVFQWDPQPLIYIQARWRDQYGDMPGFEGGIIINSNYLMFAWLGGF